MKNTEIERKWLMDAFPELPHEGEVFIEQGYLCFEPVTLRIRKTVAAGQSSYALTVKGKGTLVRTEMELPMDEGQYGSLLPLLAAPAAKKRLRYYALPGGLRLECSLVDQGEPGAFYYAEVEFASEAEAVAFIPPAWLGREVTGEPGYSMAAYCRKKGEAS